MSGGTVERAPTGEVGWYPIDVEPWSDLPHGPWFEYHFDHCVLPPSAKVWARNENAVQAFHVGRHLGVQFHPEVDADQLERWFASPGSDPRAHADREAELLARTREETPAARHRAGILVDLFLTHAALVEAPR
jgi:GMP synthase-like glutamine amidotransferase